MKLYRHLHPTALAFALTCLFALPVCVFSQAPTAGSAESDEKQRDDKRNRKGIDEYNAQTDRFDPDLDGVRRRRASLRLVVMITGELDGSPAVGAGIAFGRGDGKLYIATANHVVRRGTAHARNLTVKLRDAPSAVHDAQLMPLFDASADLAVLSVDMQTIQGIDVCSWLFFPLKNAKDVKRGDAVYLVGNPNGFEWELSVKPDMVAQADKTRISFQSAFLNPGHSGGALLDEQGHLVGMIQSDLPPRGAALTLSDMLPILRQWDYVVELYKHSYEPIEAFDSALEEATSVGDLNTVRRLVASCPNVNAVGYKGRTPLHIAAKFGQVDIVRFFLNAGAYVNVKTETSGRDIRSTNDSTPLELATFGGHIETVKVLLAAGAPVNGPARWGRAPLHWAAQAGRREMIDLLCTHGADVNVRVQRPQDNDSRTPLHIAAAENKLEAVQALLARGANVNAHSSDYNKTALHYAAGEKHVEVVRALLAAGADVNAEMDAGSTPLDSSENSAGTREATREVQDLLRSQGAKNGPVMQKLLRRKRGKD